MSFDLPDETSRLYSFVRRLDRRVTKLRQKAASRQPAVRFRWPLLTMLLIIPALARPVLCEDTYRCLNG